MSRLILVCGSAFGLLSCATPPHYDPQADENLTVGTVQREIRLGMMSAEVAEALGSPNVVSTDADRNEVWMYDKISTQVIRSDVSAGVWVLLFGGSGGGLGGVGASQSSSASSQRTLTIIIKFDEQDRVRDFAYHTSRF
jgi:hypothetical protein